MNSFSKISLLAIIISNTLVDIVFVHFIHNINFIDTI